MKLILQIGDHDGDDTVTYKTVTEFPLSLGRGFVNDIILPDPHISPRHAEIHHTGTEWVLRDLASDNGIQLNGQPLKDGQATLKSGDSLMMGRTPVMIFDPNHTVAPTQKLERTSPFIAHVSGFAAPWVYFVLAIAAICLMDYITVWTENTAGQVTKMAGGIAFGILLWTLPWSVVGRLIRHRSGFRAHVGLISLCVLLAAIFWPVQDLLNFLTNQNTLSVAFEYVVNFALVAGLVYGSLTVATHMQARRRISAAFFFTLGMFGITFAMTYMADEAFIPQPEYAAVLEPYLQNLPAGTDADGFMTENLNLFDSDALKIDSAEAADTAKTL